MGNIIAFVGPSGAGKTMLMDAVLERLPHASVVRSVTTRMPRDKDDHRYYDFFTVEEFQQQIADGAFAHWVQHAGNYYGTRHSDIAAATAHGFGLGAFVEQGVLNLRQNGYMPKVIKIIPLHYRGPNDPTRLHEDKMREQIDLGPDLVMENSFLPGGKEQSITRVLEFLGQSTAESA